MMRILLADDHPEVRSALRLMLEQEPENWAVVGEASDAGGLCAALDACAPDLVLLDWELPGLHASRSGVNTRGNGPGLKELRRLHPLQIFVVLSGRTEARNEAALAGADIFVSKGDPPERLLETLRQLDHQSGVGRQTGQ